MRLVALHEHPNGASVMVFSTPVAPNVSARTYADPTFGSRHRLSPLNQSVFTPPAGLNPSQSQLKPVIVGSVQFVEATALLQATAHATQTDHNQIVMRRLPSPDRIHRNPDMPQSPTACAHASKGQLHSQNSREMRTMRRTLVGSRAIAGISHWARRACSRGARRAVASRGSAGAIARNGLR